jgi:hypothetical protein
MMGSDRGNGSGLYHEEVGQCLPILLIHPSGSTASTWGSVVDEFARIGRVITDDRQGYARYGCEAVGKVSTHTTDAAALLVGDQTRQHAEECGLAAPGPAADHDVGATPDACR